MRFRSFSTLLLTLVAPMCGKAQTWKFTNPMTVPRAECQAVQLDDKRILVIGGYNNTGAVAECEIYNPTNNTWKSAESMSVGRYRFELQKLLDGRVLVMGGLVDLGVATTADCEIFDPKTEKWHVTAEMSEPREAHSSVILADGRVFVGGGMNANIPSFLKSCEIFDPASESFTAANDMPSSAYAHAFLYSSDLNIILSISGTIGGFGGSYTTDCFEYDVTTDSWTIGPDLNVCHNNARFLSGRVSDGNLVVLSGRSAASATTKLVEVFDILSRTWKSAAQLPTSHWHSYAFQAIQDSFLIVGGVQDPGPYQSVIDKCSWYNYSTGQTRLGPSLNQARWRFAGVSYLAQTEYNCKKLQELFVFGGADENGNALTSAEALSLGNKPEPAEILLSVGVLKLPACSSLDTAIHFSLKGCSNMSLVSIDIDQVKLGLQIDQSNLPIDLTGKSEIRIPIQLSKSGNSEGVVKLTFLTDAGPVVRFVKIARDGSTRAVNYPTKVSVNGSVCDPIELRIPIRNSGCVPLRLKDPTISSSGNFALQGSADSTLSEGDSVVYVVTLSDGLAGKKSGNFELRVDDGTQVENIIVPFDADVSTGTPSPSRLLISDPLPSYPGEYVRVPVYLTRGSGILSHGMSMKLSFDQNALELIEMDLRGNVLEGSPFVDLNRTAAGSEFYVPGDFTLATDRPLCTLLFKTFLSERSCTTVKLTSVLFSPDDPKFTTCVLQTNLDSATVCVQDACGDATIRSFMLKSLPRELRVSKSVAGEYLPYTYRSSSAATLSVFTITGELVKSVSLPESIGLSQTCRLSTVGLTSGVYSIQLDHTPPAKFVVLH